MIDSTPFSWLSRLGLMYFNPIYHGRTQMVHSLLDDYERLSQEENR